MNRGFDDCNDRAQGDNRLNASLGFVEFNGVGITSLPCTARGED